MAVAVVSGNGRHYAATDARGISTPRVSPNLNAIPKQIEPRSPLRQQALRLDLECPSTCRQEWEQLSLDIPTVRANYQPPDTLIQRNDRMADDITLRPLDIHVDHINGSSASSVGTEIHRTSS
jgi:hypothetical protein